MYFVALFHIIPTLFQQKLSGRSTVQRHTNKPSKIICITHTNRSDIGQNTPWGLKGQLQQIGMPSIRRKSVKNDAASIGPEKRYVGAMIHFRIKKFCNARLRAQRLVKVLNNIFRCFNANRHAYKTVSNAKPLPVLWGHACVGGRRRPGYERLDSTEARSNGRQTYLPKKRFRCFDATLRFKTQHASETVE